MAVAPPALRHPEWIRAAVLYQLNTRQFTPEGTLAAAESHLPRLKALGVDVIWLMPIHEIGLLGRKGGLGSPYAVRDYYSVSAELGTEEDLRRFVAEAHRLGLYVILDWVANHTARDAVLLEQHPEWYKTDWRGRPRTTAWCDWSDVLDLDYSHEPLRRYMVAAMTYWVAELDVDGFRADVAGFVPTDFWAQVRAALEEVKPVFMLAVWESRDLHAAAFDATYAWSWYNAMHGIARKKEGLRALNEYYAWTVNAYPRDAMRMTFVSNHDKNSWEGTQFEQFGPALEAAIALSVVGEGIPLVYSGQEAGNPRRLAFFDRDPIEWRAHPIGERYRRLLAFRKEVRALDNGAWGARMIQAPNSASDDVLSFSRIGPEDGMFAVFNLSDRPHRVSFGPSPHHGTHRRVDVGSDAPPEPDEIDFTDDTRLDLEPWGFRLYHRLS